jgi:nucleotide-binding universal stress UspA family protein
MKKLLIPVDFSSCSENALKYAMELSQNIEAELFLLHVFHIPVPVTDVPYISISLEDEDKQVRLQMRQLADKISKQTSYKGEIQLLTEMNFTIEGIVNKAKDIEADLLIMGQRGKTTFADRLFGSTATNMINHSPCPVLIVPETAHYSPINQIAAAVDYKQQPDQQHINKLLEYAQVLKAAINFFTINNDEEKNNLNSWQWNDLPKDIKSTFHVQQHDDIHEGILSFIQEHTVQWLCMFPHRHHFFELWFTRLNSGNMSQQVPIPLLLINETIL